MAQQTDPNLIDQHGSMVSDSDLKTTRQSEFMMTEPVNSDSRSWLSGLIRLVDPRHWLRTILHLDDSPHSIALGTAIGLFVGFTPTVGIQMAIVAILAVATGRLFRFNRIAGLIAVYVSNPLTMVPIYWYNYKLGTVLFPETITWNEFKHLFHYSNFSEWWFSLKTLFATVGMPLLAGSFVAASLVAAISYPVMRTLASRVQKHRREHPRHPQHRDRNTAV